MSLLPKTSIDVYLLALVTNNIYFSENDITVFVDLASSTMGEDDLAREKTRSLLNSLTGYSPLLYDLQPEIATFENFLELCQKVWQNLEINPDLPDNLVSN